MVIALLLKAFGSQIDIEGFLNKEVKVLILVFYVTEQHKYGPKVHLKSFAVHRVI